MTETTASQARNRVNHIRHMDSFANELSTLPWWRFMRRKYLVNQIKYYTNILMVGYSKKQNKNMKVDIYRSGWPFPSWKWRLIDDENMNIGYGRGFNTREGVIQSLSAISQIVKEHGTLYFEIYYSGYTNMSWKWRLKAKNGRILASDRGFVSEEEAYDGVSAFIEYFKDYL